MVSDFALPPDRPLTLAAYRGRPCPEAFVEPTAVGASLAETPLFLTAHDYVPVRLEATYQEEWQVFPAPLKRLLEAPAAPPDGV
jgi:hypothetical protein